MEKHELERTLHSLGKRFALDILETVHNTGPCTASEIALSLDIQVATAVKHLTDLYKVGILVRDVRKGKTRSAYEYSLKNERIIIEIDVGELGGRDESLGGADHLFHILFQITKKMSAFTGKEDTALVGSWKQNIGGHDEALDGLTIALMSSPADGLEHIVRISKDIDLTAEIPALIFDILKSYEGKYGKNSMRSLARTSRDAALRTLADRDAIEQVESYLPKRYFDKETVK